MKNFGGIRQTTSYSRNDARHICWEKGTKLLWNDQDGSSYCFYNNCQNYFKASCVNRPFEHINRSTTFVSSYCYYSTSANSWFNAYLHVLNWIYIYGLSISHLLCEKLFSKAFSSRTCSQIPNKNQKGNWMSYWKHLFSANWNLGNFALPVNQHIRCGLTL